MARVNENDDIISQKYDRCIAQTLLNAGSGFVAGMLASVILFRGRRGSFGIMSSIGAGVGIGRLISAINRV